MNPQTPSSKYDVFFTCVAHANNLKEYRTAMKQYNHIIATMKLKVGNPIVYNHLHIQDHL